jgi:hypothetical protein
MPLSRVLGEARDVDRDQRLVEQLGEVLLQCPRVLCPGRAGEGRGVRAPRAADELVKRHRVSLELGGE